MLIFFHVLAVFTDNVLSNVSHPFHKKLCHYVCDRLHIKWPRWYPLGPKGGEIVEWASNPCRAYVLDLLIW